MTMKTIQLPPLYHNLVKLAAFRNCILLFVGVDPLILSLSPFRLCQAFQLFKSPLRGNQGLGK